MIIRNSKKPLIESSESSDLAQPPFKGLLFGSSVILTNLNEIKALRNQARFGSFGLNLSHIHPEEKLEKKIGVDSNIYIDYKVEKLILTPEEAFYLVIKNILQVYNDADELLKAEQLWNIFRCDIHFIILYTAYEHFSDAGWFVKPCSKYGGNFELYTKEVKTHGPYIVFIELAGKLKQKYPKLFPENNYSAILAQNRVLESAKKSLVLLLIDWPDNFQPDKGLKQFKKIELEFHRFEDIYKLNNDLIKQEEFIDLEKDQD